MKCHGCGQRPMGVRPDMIQGGAEMQFKCGAIGSEICMACLEEYTKLNEDKKW